jgi:hypothetical protein
MEVKKVIRIITDGVEEQQFILSRFPQAYWNIDYNKTTFYIDSKYEKDIVKAVKEWRKRSKK